MAITGGEHSTTLVGTIVFTAMDKAWSLEPGKDDIPDSLGLNSAFNKNVSRALEKSTCINNSDYKYLVYCGRFLFQEGPRKKFVDKIDAKIISYMNKTENRYNKIEDNEKYKDAVLNYWMDIINMNNNYDRFYDNMKSAIKVIDLKYKN